MGTHWSPFYSTAVSGGSRGRAGWGCRRGEGGGGGGGSGTHWRPGVGGEGGGGGGGGGAVRGGCRRWGRTVGGGGVGL